MTEFFVRSYPLSDIQIRSGGDGRTVEAYAAVFKTPAEIRDQDGHYMEEIDPTAFNRTIVNRRNKFGVFYNHGLTIHGTPSDRGSVPIGTPLEVQVDNVGVRTVTQYNRTALAEEVLEAINSGAITAQSFTGRFLRSNPRKVPRTAQGGKLPTVTRMEIDMREYGPTPFPAYAEAMITGVRSAITLRLGNGDTELLVAELARRRAVADLVADGMTEEEILEILGQGVPEIGSTRGTVPTDELTGSRGQDTPSVDPSGQDTPTRDPSTGDPAPKGHSVRRRVARVARQVKLMEGGPSASTQEVGGSQGDPGGIQG